MAIYLELFAGSDVRDEHGSVLKQLQNHIRTIPSQAQLPMKELKARIVELELWLT